MYGSYVCIYVCIHVCIGVHTCEAHADSAQDFDLTVREG